MARKRSSPPPEIPADDSDHVDAAASDEEQQSIESDSKNDVAEDQNGQEDSEEEDAESVNPKEIEKQVSSQGSESIGKESGSGSGSGSESSPVPVKPIRSKPMKVLSKGPDPKPKRKRATVAGGAAAKRARGVSNANGGDEKRSGITRLWSEDDEIAILQGLIDYQLANDEDPYSDLEAFYQFVKDSLHVNVSVKQFIDKIRRLKKKFLVNADKGTDVVFAKPHEDKSFKLSKKIWGGGNGGEDASKVKAARKKNKKKDEQVLNNGKDYVDDIENGVEVDEEDDEALDFKAMYPYLGKAWESDFGCSQPLKDISMGNFQLMETEKIRAMEKEWKDMYVKEMQLYVNKLDLKTKHAKVVLDQMISSDL